MKCSLCEPTLGPVLHETTTWQLVLNHNQNLLGKCFLALRRHLEVVPDLTSDEWAMLQSQIQLANTMLSLAFAPDHVNYAFLQNQDRHIHLHIIPRYATPRQFAGLIFADVDYPAHYAVPSPVRRLEPAQQRVLADLLQQQLRTLSTPNSCSTV